MCKTKMAVNAFSPKNPKSKPQSPPPSSSAAAAASASSSYSSSAAYSSGFRLTSSTASSNAASLSSFRHTLPENPTIYDFSEISAATNNFLAKRHSSSSSSASASASPSWRCTLRNRDVIIFQRKFRRKLHLSQLKHRLAVICRSHHSAVVKLLGASISGDHIFLVYDFIHGANLSDILRNPRNPNFTVLNTWLSRMQVATDLAGALDYIHNKTGLNLNFVHNHIKSSAIIITEPSLNARLSHFGAAQLCGEIDETEEFTDDESAVKLTPRNVKFEGVRGYMSPEYLTSGVATKKSDVYAFGVVILELLSGNEAVKFRYDKESGEFVTRTVIEEAREVVDGGDGGAEGRLRRWVDRRLKDSFPVGVVEEVTRVALDCVHVDADKRPDMGRVAGKISRLYLKSRIWSENVRTPTSDILSASFAPR